MNELDFLPAGVTLLKSVLVRNAVRRSASAADTINDRKPERHSHKASESERWALMYARSGLVGDNALEYEDEDEDEEEEDEDEEDLMAGVGKVDDGIARVTVVSVRDYEYDDEEDYLTSQDWTSLSDATTSTKSVIRDGQSSGQVGNGFPLPVMTRPQLSTFGSAITTAPVDGSPDSLESSTASLSSVGSSSHEETRWFEEVFERLNAEEHDDEHDPVQEMDEEDEHFEKDCTTSGSRLDKESCYSSLAVGWDEELPSLIHDVSDESEESDSDDDEEGTSSAITSSPPAHNNSDTLCLIPFEKIKNIPDQLRAQHRIVS